MTDTTDFALDVINRAIRRLFAKPASQARSAKLERLGRKLEDLQVRTAMQIRRPVPTRLRPSLPRNNVAFSDAASRLGLQ